MKGLFQTEDTWACFILRMTLGFVVFAHGSQKLFGWFGGHGFAAAMNNFTQQMGIPWIFAFLAVAAEGIGPLGLFLGLLTRIAAFSIFCEMIAAIWMVHWKYGLFMNWFGQKKGEGYEYHLLVIAMCLALMILGGGKWSVDRAIATGGDPRVHADRSRSGA